MRITTRAWAAVCVVGALLLAPHTATAAVVQTTTPPPAQWGGASCATGVMSGFEWYGRELIVMGAAARCDGDETPASFAMVYFRSDTQSAGPYRSDVRSYNGGEWRGFGVLGPAREATYGVCVMSDVDTRLACGVLTPTSGYPHWTYRDISVDDPLVAKPVSPTLSPRPRGGPGNPIDPNCGGCF